MNYTVTKFLDIKPENLNKIKVMNERIDATSGVLARTKPNLHLKLPLNIIPGYKQNEDYSPLAQVMDYFQVENAEVTHVEPIKVAFPSHNFTMTELSFLRWLITSIRIDEIDTFAEIIIVPSDINHNTTYLS